LLEEEIKERIRTLDNIARWADLPDGDTDRARAHALSVMVTDDFHAAAAILARRMRRRTTISPSPIPAPSPASGIAEKPKEVMQRGERGTDFY
jgi:hypothetical protein